MIIASTIQKQFLFLSFLQEQLSTAQIKLDEEESKNIKLQQYINKLEHHSSQMQEVRTIELAVSIGSRQLSLVTDLHC